MITELELRKALKAIVVSDALDLIVRRELNAGMTNQTIYDEIASLIDTAEEWEEYRDEAREDLNGTLDALAGWCQRIADIQIGKSPTRLGRRQVDMESKTSCTS